MENITGIIIAFISGVFGPISVMYIKHALEKRKPKPDMVTEALRVGELVTSKIDHIREEFNADRVWITQFHNGGNFYPTGRSMAKFSIMYEAVSANASSVQSNFNNEQLVSGDRSSQLLISGTTDQVVAIVNSYSGLKAVSTRSAIGGLSARMSFVAMNEPTLDSSFCGQGSPANLRVIQFRSLQLEKNLIKNSVDLKR